MPDRQEKPQTYFEAEEAVNHFLGLAKEWAKKKDWTLVFGDSAHAGALENARLNAERWQPLLARVDWASEQYRYEKSQYGGGNFTAKTAEGPGGPLKPRLLALLSLLRAASQVHWTEHWQTSGVPFYADHLMFERFYNGMIEEIDGLAEKIVGQYGSEAVNPLDQMQRMTNWVAKWTKEPNLLDMASRIEDDIQQSLEETLETAELNGEASYGMQNFLQGIADAHETNQYLLGQRMTTASLADRYMERFR